MAGSAIVSAVHQDEIRAFLERFGVAESYESGELACSICGHPLIEAGLGAARGADGDIVFVCAKLDCQDEFHTA